MKTTILFLVMIVATVAAEQETYKLPQAIVDKVKKYATPCADENGLDHSIILKVASGKVPDTDAGRKFIYCFTTAADYVAEDGHMKVDKLAQILKDHPLQEQFRDALNKCNEVTKEDPYKTVMYMHQCFAERPPIRLLF